MAKKASAKKAPAKRKPRAKKPLTDELQIIKPVPEEIISFNAGQVLSGRFLRKRLNLNGEIETYSLAPITIPKEAVVDTTEYGTPIEFPAWLVNGLKAVALFVLGSLGGIWVSGGIEVGPGPLPADSVSAVFDTQESAFRSLSGERAKALRAGEIKSEADSASWMSSRFIPQAEAAWIVLLTEEAKSFGGEQWTAEKEAAHIERYAR